jgi:putative ABC transport system permease protein
MDATVPVYLLRTMDTVMYEAVGKPRFITFLLVVFAGLALLLASIGIYGVMSYSVAQRTRELGIRMALGAQAGGVRRLVMAEGMLLAGVGVLAGLAAAFAVNTGLSKKLAGILYETGAVDPATFVGVAAVVLAVAAAASFVPALRATRVDPMVALRHD